MNRRELLLGGPAAIGALSAWSPLLAQVSDDQAMDQSVVNFWLSEAHTPYDAFTKRVAAQGAPAYQPEFVYYVKPGEFHTSSEITTDDLPDKGTAKVSVVVDRFRPSANSNTLLRNFQSGSLRVDVKQTTPLPSIGEALAWTAVAAFEPKTGNQLPDIKDLSFDPGTTWGQVQQIPLSNGLGFWSWNVFLKKADSVWAQFMNIFKTADQVVFPVLGLPAIAITALTAVDKLIAYAQAKGESNFLFKSVDTLVYATKEGMSNATGVSLPLKSGSYLIIPRTQLQAFGAARSSLELVDGYLVKQGTDEFARPSEALTEIPAVDYLALTVKVSTDSSSSGAATNVGTTGGNKPTNASPAGTGNKK